MRRKSSAICGGNIATIAFESPFDGRSQRSEVTVWSTQTSTVSRKLPIITATATIIPVASASAAVATEVRRSDAGIDAAASCPTMPKARRIGASSARDAAMMMSGASSEKPATVKSTAT